MLSTSPIIGGVSHGGSQCLCREHKRSSSAWFWPAASRVASRNSAQCSQAWPGMHALVALSRTTCVSPRARGVNAEKWATLVEAHAAPQDICEEQWRSARPSVRRAVCWIRRDPVCPAVRHLRRDPARRPKPLEYSPSGAQQTCPLSPRSRRRPWPPPTRPMPQDLSCTPLRRYSQRAVLSACGDDAAANPRSNLPARARVKSEAPNRD